MKLRVAKKNVWISPTTEFYIIFTALVLPLSTFIVDEVFSLSAVSHIYNIIYIIKQYDMVCQYKQTRVCEDDNENENAFVIS